MDVRYARLGACTTTLLKVERRTESNGRYLETRPSANGPGAGVLDYKWISGKRSSGNDDRREFSRSAALNRPSPLRTSSQTVSGHPNP